MGRQQVSHVHASKLEKTEASYPSWLKPCGDTACTLAVHAKPGAKTYGLSLGADTLDITIDAPAREGEANAAILEYLASVLGLKKRAVSLAAGAKSREKVVRVEGASAEAVLQRLREAAAG